MAPPTHYQVLGVVPSASLDEVRTAYRAAARTCHPDSGGSVDAMQRLNEAWHVLSDPGRRAAYDRSLAGAGSARGPGSSATGSAAGAGPPPRPHVGGLDADGDPAWPWASPAGVEGWWAMLPPAFLVVAVCFAAGAVMLASPALLVFAGAALFVSLCLFVLVPMRSMLQGSRRRGRRRED